MECSASCRFMPTPTFSLRISAGPIAWAAGRSPRAAITGREVVLVDTEDGSLTVRRIRQEGDGVRITPDGPTGSDAQWFARTFRAHDPIDRWGDPVIASLAERYPGLRSYTDGSLFTGLVTSIIGQSISIASAMSVQRRLALSFHRGVDVDGRTMAPLPTPEDLAEAPVALIRESGVTWKRAEGLQAIAREAIAGNLPPDDDTDLSTVERELVKLPMVGPWTAASTLLWGIGAADAFPKGDVALLRAARLAYDDDGMTMRDLDALAERWRPHRAIATRLLWTGLLGPGWE